jgi:hypothetical protein
VTSGFPVRGGEKHLEASIRAVGAGVNPAAGRMHQDGAHTALCYLDMIEHKMIKLLKLPSGGDTSYPGLVWYDNLLYMSYYSSHEGKTSIYLARVKVVM